MLRSIVLSIVLFLFWLALSGHYNTFLLAVGVATTIFTVFIVTRMGATEKASDLKGKGNSLNFALAGLVYFPWLVKEIIKSAWAVTQIITHPQLPISPTMAKIRASHKTSVGIATYANSITLTPGTLTTNVAGQELIVHALVSDGIDDLEQGIMDAKVAAIESAGGAD